MVKNLPANTGDAREVSLITGSPGEGNNNPLQYSCLENEEPGGLQLSNWIHSSSAFSIRSQGKFQHLQKNWNPGGLFGSSKQNTINWKVVRVKVTQSCPTLCNPMDYTVHGILQARILEWVACPFSRGSSQSRDRTQVCCIVGRFFTSWTTREA